MSILLDVIVLCTTITVAYYVYSTLNQIRLNQVLFFDEIKSFFHAQNQITPLSPVQPDDTLMQELSSYELMRLQREEEFDQRISKLRADLASAEEFHPAVRNLPHGIVPNQTIRDEEVSI